MGGNFSHQKRDNGAPPHHSRCPQISTMQCARPGHRHRIPRPQRENRSDAARLAMSALSGADGPCASPPPARSLRTSPKNASNLRLNGGEGGIRTLGTGYPVRQISNLVPSTTRPPLRRLGKSPGRQFLRAHRETGNLASPGIQRVCGQCDIMRGVVRRRVSNSTDRTAREGRLLLKVHETPGIVIQ